MTDPLIVLKESYDQHVAEVEEIAATFEAERERIQSTKPKDRKHIKRLEEEESGAFQAYEAALEKAQLARSARDNKALVKDAVRKNRERKERRR